MSADIQKTRELKRDIVIELTNANFEAYRYDRPNDSVEQLTAFCRDIAENEVDELLELNRQQALTALLEAMPEKPVMPTLEEYMKAVKYAEAHYKYDDMFDYAYKTAIKDVTAIIEERLKT